MSLVSIVIPAYNRERVLRNAVESALAQTYQDIEILLVDDGSTDATSQIGMQLADSFPCIRFLKHLHNQGAQAARNSGIKATQGDWFTFLDSDDELLPESIELRLKKAQQETGACCPFRMRYHSKKWAETALRSFSAFRQYLHGGVSEAGPSISSIACRA